MTVLTCCQDKSNKNTPKSTEIDTTTSLDSIKRYLLRKKIINADFDYSKLEDIDKGYSLLPKPRSIITLFEPIRGKYNYYQFIATFKGRSYNDGGPTLTKDFHDILIIKTDKEDKILDSYQYTIEWAELPCQFDLYRGSARNILLKNDLEIANLKLIRANDWKEEDRSMNERGILKLK